MGRDRGIYPRGGYGPPEPASDAVTHPPDGHMTRSGPMDLRQHPHDGCSPLIQAAASGPGPGLGGKGRHVAGWYPPHGWMTGGLASSRGVPP